jgi:hypothetical protein
MPQFLLKTRKIVKKEKKTSASILCGRKKTCYGDGFEGVIGKWLVFHKLQKCDPWNVLSSNHATFEMQRRCDGIAIICRREK